MSRTIRDITVDEWNELREDKVSDQAELDDKINNLSSLDRSELMFFMDDVEVLDTSDLLFSVVDDGREYFITAYDHSQLLVSDGVKKIILSIKPYTYTRLETKEHILEDVREVSPFPKRLSFDKRDELHNEVRIVLSSFMFRWEEIAHKIYQIIMTPITLSP